MITQKIGIAYWNISDDSPLYDALSIYREWILGVSNNEFDVVFSFFDITGRELTPTPVPGLSDRHMVSRYQMGDIGYDMVRHMQEYFDVVCLAYNHDMFEQSLRMVAVQNPMIVAGFTMIQLPVMGVSDAPHLAHFFAHELMHAYYYLINLRDRGLNMPDYTHERGGLWVDGPPGYDEIFRDEMKPYWNLLINQANIKDDSMKYSLVRNVGLPTPYNNDVYIVREVEGTIFLHQISNPEFLNFAIQSNWTDDWSQIKTVNDWSELNMPYVFEDKQFALF